MAELLEDSPELQALADFAGSPESFWPLYVQALAQASGARRALLLSSAVGQPWRARAQWPATGGAQSDDARRSLALLGQAGQAVTRVPHGQACDLVLWPPAGDEVLAVLLLDLPEALDAQALGERALRIATEFLARQRLPAVETLGPAVTRDVPQAAEKAERLHEILRLARALSEETRFVTAAMTVCNQICRRFGAERVCLGWRQGAALRLVAISHVENFDAKAKLTRALEEAMEEALEQESLLCFPPAEGEAAVTRAHQAYAQALEAAAELQLCSLPLPGQDTLVGVLCLERVGAPWTAAELWELERLGQACAPWLTHLRQRDRWFGLRWWDDVRAASARALGPRHTAWKASGLALALFLVLGSLWPWPYRIDATLAVRSRDLLFMPAPFDGYLRQVHVDVGQQVPSGAVLVELDTRDLLLEESMAEADLARYTREAEKAMAARQLAEMQIALARQQQAQAKLELIRYQLANAQLKAPFEGVVIEGELKKNLGAPVRKGDLLLKLARSTRTYLELEIDQAYVHEVAVGTRGEFALVGRPDQRLPITLTQLDPAAVSKDGRTVYLARAALVGQQQPDWRPGMGGNAKLQAGDRPLIWVLTHRTVRFLREFFWL